VPNIIEELTYLNVRLTCVIAITANAIAEPTNAVAEVENKAAVMLLTIETTARKVVLSALPYIL